MICTCAAPLNLNETPHTLSLARFFIIGLFNSKETHVYLSRVLKCRIAKYSSAMLRNQFWLVFTVSAFLLASCSSSLKVSNFASVESLKDEAFFYALPTTVLQVDVSAVRTVYRKGPYAKYAEKYLGVKDYIRNDYENWTLTDLSLSSRSWLDYNQFYVIKKIDPDDALNLLQPLIDRQLVFPVLNPVPVFDSHSFVQPLHDETGMFPSLMMKDNLVEREKTVYETITSDTASFTVMKKQKLYSSMTEEEKAEELADDLIRLRKRRFKLLAAIEKNTLAGEPRQFEKEFPEGEALVIMLQRLDSLEKDIMSLFIGESYEETFVRNFEFTPLTNSTGKYELFRFSSTKGFLPRTSDEGYPVFLQIEKEGQLQWLEGFAEKKDETTYRKVVFRIPELSLVSVYLDNSLLIRQKFQIYQLGPLTNVGLF